MAVDTRDYVNNVLVSSSGNDASNLLSSPLVVPLNNATGEVTINGSVGSNGDTSDIYSFTALESGFAHATLTNLTATGKISIFESSATSTDQALISVGAVTSSQRIAFKVEAGETYRVLVGVSTGAQTTYDLLIDTPRTQVVPPPDPPPVVDPEPEPPVNPVTTPDLVNGALTGVDAGKTIETALQVSPNDSGIISIKGSAGIDGDSEDWFVFTALQTGETQISLSGFSSDMYTKIYDMDNHLLGTTYGVSGTTKDLIPNLAAGQKYIVVVVDNAFVTGGSTYDLKIDMSTGDSINDVPVDGVAGHDAGNSSANAVAVAVAEGTYSIQGSLTTETDTKDYYRFTLPETPGLVTLDRQNFAGILSVDNAGVLVEVPADQNSFEVNGGSYDLVVTAEDGGSLGYAFDLSFSAFVGIDHVNGTPVTGLDAGASVDSAAVIDLTSGSASVEGRLKASGDQEDFYRVTLPVSDATLSVDFSDFAGTISLVIDGDTFEVAHQVYELALDGGTYDLVVTAPVPTDLDYQFDLMISSDTQSDLVDGNLLDGGDAGDTFALATELTLGSGASTLVQGSVGFGADPGDVFIFSVATGGQVQIDLTHLEQILSAQLFQADGQQVQTTTTATTADKVLNVNLTAGEDYYLVVDPFLGAQSVYELTFVMA